MTPKVLLVSLTAVAVTIAQPPQRKVRQRTPRETPPGGISVVAFGYNGLALVRLLEVPEIQAELKFTDEDRASLPVLREEMAESAARFKTVLTDAAAKGRDTLVETLLARSKEVDQQMTEILGGRFKRCQELRRQAFGIMAAATSDAPVRESLGITQDQRDKFNAERKNLLARIREQIGQGRRSSDSGSLDLGMRDFAVQEEKLFKDLLTDAQRAKWQELIGAPMEMPQEVLRFVRRGDFGPRDPATVPSEKARKKFREDRRKRSEAGPAPSGEGEKRPPQG